MRALEWISFFLLNGLLTAIKVSHYSSREDFEFNEGRDPAGNWELFSPLARFGAHSRHNHIAPPEVMIKDLESQIVDLDRLTDEPDDRPPVDERARRAYIDFLATYLLGEAFGKSEKSVLAALRTKPKVAEFDPKKRNGGGDWAYFGKTMVGHKRLENVQELVMDVINKDIPGAFLEAGVWRGGVDIFVRGIFRAYRQNHRPVIVCDSFHGLPPGNTQFHKYDVGWDKTSYLEVSAPSVARNFLQSALLDEEVYFAKGFFNETMPQLAKQVKRIAVLRMDGDIYQSTVDVLYHLYDKVPVGGWVILDDWLTFPSRFAVEDFMRVHDCKEDIKFMDELGAYWQKTKAVDIQFWRYQKRQFN